MIPLNERFSANLKRERTKRQLSQEALASKARLSTSYVSMLERGLRSPPLGTLEQVAKAIGVSPTSLLE